MQKQLLPTPFQILTLTTILVVVGRELVKILQKTFQLFTVAVTFKGKFCWTKFVCVFIAALLYFVHI